MGNGASAGKYQKQGYGSGLDLDAYQSPPPIVANRQVNSTPPRAKAEASVTPSPSPGTKYGSPLRSPEVSEKLRAAVQKGAARLGVTTSGFPPERILVANVEPGSRADRTGVAPGDELMAVNGHSIVDLAVHGGIEMETGKPLQLTFKIQPENQTKTAPAAETRVLQEEPSPAIVRRDDGVTKGPTWDMPPEMKERYDRLSEATIRRANELAESLTGAALRKKATTKSTQRELAAFIESTSNTAEWDALLLLPERMRQESKKETGGLDVEVSMQRAKVLTTVALQDAKLRTPETGLQRWPRPEGLGGVGRGGGRRMSYELESQQAKARARMQTNRSSIKGAMSYHNTLQDSAKQAEECLRKLQYARFARAGDLTVCERRLELLGQRPVQDNASDLCMEAVEALENERQALKEARQELLDFENEMKHLLMDLQDSKKDISRECATSQSAVLQGMRELRSDYSFVNSYSFCARPSTDQASFKASHSHSSTQLNVTNFAPSRSMNNPSFNYQGETQQSREESMDIAVDNAKRLLEEAANLCNRSEETIQFTQDECNKAAAQTWTALSRCAAEEGELKGRLEEQLSEVDSAVATEKWSMNTTPKWPENQASLERTRTLLHELTVARQDLQEPQRRSATCLQILDQCKRTTATSASGPLGPSGKKRRPASAGAAGRASATATAMRGNQGARQIPQRWQQEVSSPSSASFGASSAGTGGSAARLLLDGRRSGGGRSPAKEEGEQLRVSMDRCVVSWLRFASGLFLHWRRSLTVKLRRPCLEQGLNSREWSYDVKKFGSGLGAGPSPASPVTQPQAEPSPLHEPRHN